MFWIYILVSVLLLAGLFIVSAMAEFANAPTAREIVVVVDLKSELDQQEKMEIIERLKEQGYWIEKSVLMEDGTVEYTLQSINDETDEESL